METLQKIRSKHLEIATGQADHYVLFEDESDAMGFMSKFTRQGIICEDIEAVQHSGGLCVRAVHINDPEQFHQYASDFNGIVVTSEPHLIMETNVDNARKTIAQDKNTVEKKHLAIMQRAKERDMQKKAAEQARKTRIEVLQQIANGEEIDYFGINQAKATKLLALYDSLNETNKHQMLVLLSSKEGMDKITEFNQELRV